LTKDSPALTKDAPALTKDVHAGVKLVRCFWMQKAALLLKHL